MVYKVEPIGAVYENTRGCYKEYKAQGLNMTKVGLWSDPVVLRYLIDSGANVSARYNLAARLAYENNHLVIVDYLNDVLKDRIGGAN